MEETAAFCSTNQMEVIIMFYIKYSSKKENGKKKEEKSLVLRLENNLFKKIESCLLKLEDSYLILERVFYLMLLLFKFTGLLCCMINYSECRLYRIKRKKDILFLLFKDEQFDYANIIKYNVKIEKNQRLVEHAYSNSPLKKTQTKIYKYLREIHLPDYLYSKKGSSAISNGIYHKDNDYITKIDISGFFPNSHRNYIYIFFNNKLECSPDVSKILTDLTTININDTTIHNASSEVSDFFSTKKIRSFNHLPTGTSTSPILCFLAYEDMFNSIKKEAEKRDYSMTVYVDDITFSSISKIENGFIVKVNNIINSYKHRVNMKKTVNYTKEDNKKITGIIVSKNKQVKIPPKIHYDIINLFYKIHSNKHANKDVSILKGKLNYARTIKKGCFPNILKYINNIDL